MGAEIRHFCDQFLVARQRSLKTAQAYRCDWEQFVGVVGAGFAVADLDGPHLEEWIGWLRRRNSKPATIRRKIASVRGFLRQQRKRGVLCRDPFEMLDVDLGGDRQLTRTLSDRDFDSLLATADGQATDYASASQEGRLRAQRDQAMIWLLCGTGLRVGELVALKLSDADATEGVLRVDGKGRRQRLAFAVDGDRERLAAYLRTRALFRFDHNRVFVNRLGRPITTEGVRTVLVRVARMSGIDHRITPHMLRHTAATRLLNHSGNLRIVQEFLGHSSIRMTERYTHVSAAVLRRAVTEYSPLKCRSTRRAE